MLMFPPRENSCKLSYLCNKQLIKDKKINVWSVLLHTLIMENSTYLEESSCLCSDSQRKLHIKIFLFQHRIHQWF